MDWSRLQSLCLSVAIGGLLALPLLAQQPGAAAELAATIPEVEAIRAPYQRNLAAIRTNRDARVSVITKSYLAALERLQRERTSTGDLDGALLVKAEHERTSGGEEPTVDERKSMPAPLAALRTRYEKDREPIVAAARQQEEQQSRSYVAALDSLQKRFTTQNQLEKAVAVKNERDRLVESASTPVAAGGAVLPATPTKGSGAALDPGLAEKIEEVVRTKSFVKTETSAEEGGRVDVHEPAGLLVGFEFTETQTDRVADIRSLRPFYLTADGVVPGKDMGDLPKVTEKVQARNGYAVAGISTWHNRSNIGGIQVIFMKIDLKTGKFDPNPVNTYKSKWFGSRPQRVKAKELGADGRFVIGIYGKRGADADTIGLVQMP